MNGPHLHPHDLNGLLQSEPTPVGPEGPARAYLATAGRDGDKTLWRVYFAIDGGRTQQPIGPVLPWREALAFCHALNERAGLETVRER